ncbi:hypothetical protein AZI86_11155 [Bdellovibrio bacteriovorus]|uniref:Uncharacterized protein n=1 Tax=Bdellovibrio bacteriovorus TaxID=959 RepID=A0A150WLU0_BDEBC|nr:hypothetical protein [Bdellovibrio bacteriovorus]KYG64757.1 hypothetical protein AZI86_11155 [Bdellovibrio bacteriovorus]
MAKRSLITLLISVLTIVSVIAGVNYVVDPQCYYQCPQLDVNKRTLNSYYQVAQRILAHPDAEVIILGSSRGQTTPPLWVQEVSGLKTLNLSAAGAEATTKLAFLKIAEENIKLRKVIWLADYFELVGETRDAKIKNTPALKHFLKADDSFSVSDKLLALQGLLDHNNLEASLHFLKNRNQTEITQGSGAEIDYRLCQSSDYQGNETAESLKKEVNLLYQSYVHGVISPEQSRQAWTKFSDVMNALVAKGIEVQVVIIPYHPDFLARLKLEQPDIYQRHLNWIEQLKTLNKPGLSVADNFNGIAGADATHVNWNDGVHFNCRAAMLMLRPLITPK